VKEHDVDVLCLQETKLQASHVADLALTDCVPGYDAYFSCSVARKGYSGTAAFVRKRTGVSPTVVENGTNSKPSEASGSYAQKSGKKQKTLEGFFTSTTKKNIQTSIQAADDRDESAEGALGPTDVGSGPLPPDASRLLVPERVSFGMGLDVHDGEGRMVIMEFPLFTVCNLYVPNSGQALARLSYRVDEWDKDWLKYCLEKRRSSGRPLVWLGDLNVAHTRLEVWNDGAKHLPKQAGVTPEERASFQHQLDASGFVDAFRHLHPEARGHYSYWSQRAGNRQPNKGLRLDYFVCDPSLFVPPPRDCPGGGVSGGGNVADVDARTISSRRAVVRDSYILHDVQGSDHCPVVLEIEVMLS
jgi:exonuclease III